MMTSRLHQLSALGQSVWIDFLSRDLIESGALARAMARAPVVGVTSNPTIFEKALSRGDALGAHAKSIARACDEPSNDSASPLSK